MKKIIFFFFYVVILFFPILINAQNLKDQIPAPKTKLEEFSTRTGSVIIRGFEEIGSAIGLYNTLVKVEAKEFIEVSTGKREYGITIQVIKEGDYDRESTSYIDYDEIKSLIQGIDYISKVDKSKTKFSNFQADYSTRGDLRVSTFSTSGKTMVAVESGKIGSVTAYYNISSLAEIRTLIQSAKTKIDSLVKSRSKK